MNEDLHIDLSGVVLPTGDKRLAEAILHIASRCQNDPKFGATKLNKILFFADFSAFLRLGEPIVGCEFMRLENGPAPRRLVPVRDALVQENRAAIQKKRLVSGFEQHRIVPLAEADLREFSGEQISLLDKVIEMLRESTAQAVSELSHTVPAWELAEDGETIPIEAAFIRCINPENGDAARAEELAQQYNW